MDDNLLDELLNAAIEEVNDSQKTTLKETDIFSQETNIVTTIKKKEKSIDSKLSLVHSGDTDSSDDEDNRCFEEKKYNNYGRDLKHLLNTDEQQPTTSKPVWKSKITKNELNVISQVPKQTTKDLYTDPFFGIRIVNPLISSSVLKERMVGREAIQFSQLKRFLTTNPSEKNWVIAGVLVHKTPVKTTKNDSHYIIWTLSDLKDDIKTISLFLFGDAYREFYKTTIGTVVGILNPSINQNSSLKKDIACFIVTKAPTLMIFGQSKDFGTCKSITKNGQKCTSIVNLNRCEFCLYHIKKEYQKCSNLRSDLQSTFTGKGLTALRNKVLGKNEVFYAGKSYTAIPAKRNQKLQQKDENRLLALDQGITINNNTKIKKSNMRKAATNLEISPRQRLRDLELLERLGASVSNKKQELNATQSEIVTIESAKNTALEIIQKLKSNQNEPKPATISDQKTDILPNEPKLSRQNKIIDLNMPINSIHKNRAKVNALEYIKKNGPLKKNDPNSIKTPPTVKRSLDSSDVVENSTKKTKIEENEFLSDRFKKIMAATSIHQDLLQQHDDEASEKYFKKMEIKECLEEKMANTFKVPCKAVRCLQCKYTNFSASQRCKDEKHQLRVFDTVKRFFKCGQCGNRIVCLEIVPTTVCKNCGHGKWERTGMMKDKTVTVTNSLSIRGGEQKFVNSVVTDVNINLLVPDN